MRIGVTDVPQRRERWRGLGVPDAKIDLALAFQREWGGLVLPPAPEYEGGPHHFEVDTPWGATDGWWFEAGLQRTAAPFSFMVGPDGSFGIHAARWAPLHESVEGWIESIALAYHAARCARQITVRTGDAAAGLDLSGFDRVAEVRGMADTWWRGPDSLVALYTGEAALEGRPEWRKARIYSGLDRWALEG